MSQSYATFVSLLLVTLFKASLLGCAGICSTQYLWRVLRGPPITVSTVESLFQIRHNPLEQFCFRTIISVSFLLAAYAWTVPLAAMYPPGALTINATPFLLTESVSMSVPDLRFNLDFDPLQPANVSRLSYFARIEHTRVRESNSLTNAETVNLSTSLHPINPQEFLLRFSRSVIAAGEIILNPRATMGENSTYTLEFMGPQISCRDMEQFNRTHPEEGVFTDLMLGEIDPSLSLSDKAVRMSAMEHAYYNRTYAWQIIQKNMLGGISCGESNPMSRDDDGTAYVAPAKDPPSSATFLLETSKINCTEKYVSYVANITYRNGIRSIQYTIRDIEPQPAKDLLIEMVWEAASNILVPDDIQPRNAGIDEAFAASAYSQRSREYLEERFRYWNAFTIYAAFLNTIESATTRACFFFLKDPKCNEVETRGNFSELVVHPIDCLKHYTTPSVLENSRLNPHRYSESPKEEPGNSGLNVTEAALNELLTNITISLMTLDLWTDNINVTSTTYRNTYAFSRRINLVLPYALCLAFGLLIVGLGLVSLWQNGVPSSDGFTQVMMATRGRTEIDRLVLEQGLVDINAASKELKGLKVRYGELVMEDAVKGEKVWGFGTAEETVSLRKRK
ncbi:hypothetical protein HBH56_100850 [Parastagonospora nodorum]|uniref:Uncharacterized protein n=2 Tax=Phaeosphaeria nodorum (strain SN15 / ATCC MYA-4574 / FGSC 10173) TaxID=321614 RepID=A0A7U2ID18_PHANO|nr:hypothetical protein SNOG_13061 [Parastagonospora nodorum SN15]KAH3914253.1 hypothetical protein HBH56_100850 [Parastagonospora nodorum]EAT79388.1 hypothetical protein SNOG_13061 [Parastagonospora nodorum SN15]KAH3930529.1 hypothetical protein HBH54_115170 [Parastagonospora nodorum]KAH4136373.1 hypothetical protein HBH45_135950 [Parastagonospora nodorum]KAH4158264.1 hypothetical protein HBH44_118890 [Parastagonospora nodorum]